MAESTSTLERPTPAPARWPGPRADSDLRRPGTAEDARDLLDRVSLTLIATGPDELARLGLVAVWSTIADGCAAGASM